MMPMRLSQFKLYECLLLFTVVIGLIQITFILEPECTKAFDIRQYESSHDQTDHPAPTHENIQLKQNPGDINLISAKNVQPIETLKSKSSDSGIKRMTNQMANSSDISKDSNVVKKPSPTKRKRSLKKPLQNKNDTAFQSRVLKPAKCQNRTILVYGGIKVIRQWRELNQLVSALKPLDDGDWSTVASCDSCTVQLILSNRPGSIKGKDAVVFGMSPFSLKVKMSLFRTFAFDPRQLLVFYGAETPLRMRKWIPDVGLTPNHVVWSYSKTADIHIPYGVYKTGTPLDSKHKKASDRIHGKQKLIAWMGSNCVKEVFWPRMDFVLKLQSYIQVDIYGRCGNLTCLPRLSDECKNLMGQYKFYLSLENAECDDYVTEKFWETALMHGAVPVVYGAPKEFYTQNAPPNSFIYAGDFKTPKELATFLTRLDRNPQQYAMYFKWRYRGTVVQNYPDLKLSHFCGLVPSIDKASKMQMKKRPLSDTPWFNSCRNMRKGGGAFLPTDVNVTSWVPW
ncbi:uncharacterized protein LOC117288536 [Asterias rubens]|uniref:uncharacterized protein LOC117288536 n=1 Tax=Asterias rubens TaxID=7604 RepID=UPI0014555838|nr:uncharacterized protein LOC117288536 [Asterias rubens]XP_033625324.1 uncharacterized protein LOC117288536 [Asterias rubens]